MRDDATLVMIIIFKHYHHIAHPAQAMSPCEQQLHAHHSNSWVGVVVFLPWWYAVRSACPCIFRKLIQVGIIKTRVRGHEPCLSRVVIPQVEISCEQKHGSGFVMENNIEDPYNNPCPAKLIYLNFQPLAVVSRYRDPQPQVVGNYSYSFC